jgi:hypothetical protein
MKRFFGVKVVDADQAGIFGPLEGISGDAKHSAFTILFFDAQIPILLGTWLQMRRFCCVCANFAL